MYDLNLKCCNHKITKGDVWILKDIKDFTSRKLYKAICPYCGDDVVSLSEKRIFDGKVFVNNLAGIEAVKTIYREKKRRIVALLPNIETSKLYGWTYGVNTEIKNKKNETTQIRQYASDFYENKKLQRKMFYK